MTNKRLYLDCPIKAKYMSQYFGVKFQDFEEPHEYLEESDIECYHAPFYVHPASEEIFQPKEGDLALVFSDRYARNLLSTIRQFDQKSGWVEASYPGESFTSDKFTVIMRDNKQFFAATEEEGEKNDE